MDTLTEHLIGTVQASTVQPAMVILRAEFIGKNRAPFRKGGIYEIVVHRCAGSRYFNGQWVKDTRIQVYKPGKGRDGFKMYESAEAVRKDFAV